MRNSDKFLPKNTNGFHLNPFYEKCELDEYGEKAFEQSEEHGPQKFLGASPLDPILPSFLIVFRLLVLSISPFHT